MTPAQGAVDAILWAHPLTLRCIQGHIVHIFASRRPQLMKGARHNGVISNGTGSNHMFDSEARGPGNVIFARRARKLRSQISGVSLWDRFRTTHRKPKSTK